MAAEEVEALRAANAKLLADLQQERGLRQKAELAQQQLEADREKAQRARDELRISSHKEHEQPLVAALQLVRSVLLAEKRAQDAEDEQLQAEQELAGLMQQLRSQQQQQQQAGGSSSGSAAAADAAALQAELERERARNAELTASAAAAQAEAQSAVQQLETLRQRPKDGGGSGSGVRPSASSASLAGAEGGPEGAGLAQRIAALKAARDKLISALDLQAAEVERLSAENASLVEAVAELREVAGRWEAQAQLGLAQAERLKDLLEESATWDPLTAAAAAGGEGEATPAAAAGAGSAAAGEEGGPLPGAGEGDSAPQLQALCAKLQRELLLEKAKSAQLDLQVRALCAELTKSAQRSGQMQHALVPLLSGVERRLAEVLGLRAKAQPAAAAVES